MKRMKILMMVCMVLYACFILPGCLDLDHFQVHYDVSPELSGEMRMSFIGVHSDEETTAKQKEEMAEFYQKVHQEMGKEQTLRWGIEDAKVLFANKTELRCDATLQGKVHNFVRSLAPLTEDYDFEIKKVDKIFSVKILTGKVTDKDLVYSISIKYGGTIVSHNAHRFDEKQNLMTWTSVKLDKTGIQFVLNLKK
ncbi:MAG: hypothetical protein H8D67_06480 [Deltaproteobacteria bacterium]|nr:hypothetical protein [Deltaproteobacteria bacterium]MBL7176612.1 hypothetical protein [Desulfobacteraceae bacterium]